MILSPLKHSHSLYHLIHIWLNISIDIYIHVIWRKIIFDIAQRMRFLCMLMVGLKLQLYINFYYMLFNIFFLFYSLFFRLTSDLWKMSFSILFFETFPNLETLFFCDPLFVTIFRYKIEGFHLSSLQLFWLISFNSFLSSFIWDCDIFLLCLTIFLLSWLIWGRKGID